MNKLFVYGTLKSNYGNNVLLEGSRFLGNETLISKYFLIDLGPYPAAIPGPETYVVAGEVYEIDDVTIKRTDRLEGFPHYYNRSLVDTSYGKAWIYHFDKFPINAKECPIVRDWQKQA